MPRLETLVRVTLLEPYPSPSGEVTVSDGQEARIPLAGVYASDDDFTDPMRCANLNTDPRDPRNRTKINNAVTIVYAFNYSDPEKRVLDMPASCAKRNFGDWTIVPGQQSNMFQLAWSQEKFRVAMFWGDYGYPRPVQKGDIDMRKIRPPRFPKVSIQELDSRNHQPYGAIIYPHQVWKFDEDLDLEAIAETERRAVASGKLIEAPSKNAGIDLTALSPEQLSELRKLILGDLVPEKVAAKK